MHTFYITVLIQLYCLRHVSNIQVFILRNTYLYMQFYGTSFMHPYNQSGRWKNALLFL